jgi:hypothetical protein
MPCTPAKARHLLKSGKARPKRNKLGLFYVQLCYRQDPDNQPLVVGLDPGSKFEGLSVVGTEETVVNLMVEAPSHVKDAVTTRRTMRRARRLRKWRRPRRFDNRLNRRQRIPPSTRSRWEAKARVVRHLLTILPLTDAVIEDVRAVTRVGSRGKWNQSFSPVQVGKEHLYHLLRGMGFTLHLREGWHTKQLREQFGLKKARSKSQQSFDSHAVDGWVLAASVSVHAYRTNKRLSQRVQVKDCHVLSWVAFRSWLVTIKETLSSGKGKPSPALTGGNACFLPMSRRTAVFPDRDLMKHSFLVNGQYVGQEPIP